MTAIVGLLHTVPALARDFDARIDAAAPGLRRIHVVDAWLLETAIARGVGDDVRAAVAAHARHLEGLGARAILVTCSSIGEAAEDARAQVRVPVVRVDEDMARESVRMASTATGRIAVLATVPSTLGPTERLVRRVAAERPRAGGIGIVAEVVDGAGAARSSGDDGLADRLIAAAITAAAHRADVVLLAQASMASAAELVDPAIVVRTSPAGGVADLLRALDG